MLDRDQDIPGITMKTILVLTGGSQSDKVVFDTALAVARPMRAHLEFLHIRISPGEAAAFTPHVDFAKGAGLREAMDRLRAEADERSAEAARHVHRFCQQEAIEIADTPSRIQGVSAAWREERDDAVERMIRRTRHNDLVVLGCASGANGLPPDLIGRLLVACGRPVLVAPARAQQSVTGTALVCWKETASAARALGAALPLLSKSERVVVVGVEESAGSSFDDLRDLAQQLAWHGIFAESAWLPADGRSAAEQLAAAAGHYHADLLVMGGYGHSRARETIFGGCTQHFLDHAEWPVLMMH
ncbi:MAG: universal stress protein [Stellaceae bacterium]